MWLFNDCFFFLENVHRLSEIVLACYTQDFTNTNFKERSRAFNIVRLPLIMLFGCALLYI